MSNFWWGQVFFVERKIFSTHPHLIGIGLKNEGGQSPRTVDERPNLGYDSEKVKNFGPQTGFEPTPLEEMSFQAESSTTEL
jgi:hypothetical protein